MIMAVVAVLVVGDHVAVDHVVVVVAVVLVLVLDSVSILVCVLAMLSL